MLLMVLVRLALVSVSALIIGCNSFAVPPATTHRRGSIRCRHPRRFRCLLPPSALSRTILFSTRTPSAIMLQSNKAASILADDIDFVSNGVDGDIKIDNASRDDERDNAVALYIHIPYCRQRCRYCDFAIVPIGDHGSAKKGRGDIVDEDAVGENSGKEDPDGHSTQQSRREQGFRRMNERYVSAIVAELKQIAAINNAKANNKNCKKVPLRSIYFGGGTPSLAPIESIESILYHACGRDNAEAPFRLLQRPQASQGEADEGIKVVQQIVETEITMEMDPGTFDREYLSSLRALGINRVSLGVQSFDDDLLRAMGRTHRRADVLQAVRDIAYVFGSNKKDCKSNDNGCWDNVNYSIDLISGCPGLTPAKWVETLQEATVGVGTKKNMSTKITIDASSTTIKKIPSLLLSSLPPPKHISVYDMQIEEGTVFGNWATKAKEAALAKRKEGELSNTPYEDEEDEDEDPSRRFTVALPLDKSGEAGGRVSRGSDSKKKSNQEQILLRLPSEEDCAFMYKYASGYLRAKNYEHYEVSSYAAFSDTVECKTNRDGDDGNSKKQHIGPMSKRSVHNQIYWEYDGQWYAVGLGATSFVDKKIVARPREMNDYIEWVYDRNERIISTATTSREVNEKDDETDEDFLSDILLKRLRTIDGLDLNWLETNYGSEIVKEVLEGAELGLDLKLAEHTDGNVLRLRDPEGLLYSNFIISSIFAELGYT